jgi:hypothetical protein
VLHEGNALLLPPEDAPVWAQALCDLRRDPLQAARLARQARTDAQRYTWESRAVLIMEGLEGDVFKGGQA